MSDQLIRLLRRIGIISTPEDPNLCDQFRSVWAIPNDQIRSPRAFSEPAAKGFKRPIASQVTE